MCMQFCVRFPLRWLHRRDLPSRAFRPSALGQGLPFYTQLIPTGLPFPPILLSELHDSISAIKLLRKSSIKEKAKKKKIRIRFYIHLHLIIFNT